jgi:hypothetical protein
MKIESVTPYVILGFCGLAGLWGAKRATEIQKNAASATNLGDLLDPERRNHIKSEMEGQADDWARQLNNGLGVFMLASAASAVQSNKPSLIVFSTLFLLPALAPSFASNSPCYILALREKRDRSLFEESFYRFLKDTYYGKQFKKPVLFWIGYFSLMIPLIQEVFL